MRTIGLVGLAFAVVLAAASLGHHLADRPRAAVGRVRSPGDLRFDEARNRLEALESRLRAPPSKPDLSPIEERMGRLERRLADLDRPAPQAASLPTGPASYEDLVKRADARGGFWQAYHRVVAEEIAAWEAAAAQATDTEERSTA
jgi:hypothetical protein